MINACCLDLACGCNSCKLSRSIHKTKYLFTKDGNHIFCPVCGQTNNAYDIEEASTIVESAANKHEKTLLKLRVWELEEKVEQLQLDKDRWELACTMLRKELAKIKHEVRRWAGRPTKDGASLLLDLVDKEK